MFLKQLILKVRRLTQSQTQLMEPLKPFLILRQSKVSKAEVSPRCNHGQMVLMQLLPKLIIYLSVVGTYTQILRILTTQHNGGDLVRGQKLRIPIMD